MPNVNVNGINFHFVERGTGDAVLCVHGFPLNHEMWNEQLEAFSTDHRVIAPDLRGFGKSTVTKGTVTMEQFAADLNEFLDAIDVSTPIHFCGLSMGGYIAWPFLRMFGDRLRSLILCATRAVADTAEGKENRYRLAEKVLEHGAEFAASAMMPNLFAEETRHNRPDVIERVSQMMLNTNPEGIAAAARGMATRPDSTEMLPSIGVPTLVIVGEHDKISTAEEMRQIANSIPNAKFCEVAQAGHMVPMEQPDVVNREVRSFLSSLN